MLFMRRDKANRNVNVMIREDVHLHLDFWLIQLLCCGLVGFGLVLKKK